MRLKEKLHSRKFWLAVGIFAIIYTIIFNIGWLGWKYNFDFTAFRADRFFSENLYLFILVEGVKNFILGFFVALFSFKPNAKKVNQ